MNVGSAAVLAGDIVAVVVGRSDIRKFVRAIGLKTGQVADAIIVGGGKATYYLGRSLIKQGIKVKVIEIDSQGRINLSIRDTLPKPEGYVEEEPRRREGGRPQRERRGGFNGGREKRNFNNDSSDEAPSKGRRIEF